MSENNSSYRRIAKNTLFLYFRMMFLLVIKLYTSRVILRELGVDDYGIFVVVAGMVVILSFLNGAMANGTQRFMNIEMGRGDQGALNRVFSTSLQIHLLIALVVLLLAETIGLWFLNTSMNIAQERMYAANWVYQFAVAAALFGFFKVPYHAAIIAHEKMSAFAYISIVESVLKLIVAFAIVWSPFDKLIFYAALFSVVALINGLVFLFYGMKHFPECRCVTFKVDQPTMRSMFSFSVWKILGHLTYILHTQGIAVVINLFFSVTVNAAQGIANQVNGVVSQFTSNFLVALNPQVVKLYAAGDFSQMHSLIIRGCKVAFCMTSLFAIPLVLEAPMVLRVWLGIVPEYAVVFMRLILIITLVNSSNSLLTNAQGATGDLKTYQITLTLIAVLHLPLAWLAFSMGKGPAYAMYVYLFIVVALQSVRVLFVCKSVGLSLRLFIQSVIVRCGAVLLLSSVIPCLLHAMLAPSLQTTLLVGCASVIGVLLTTLFIGLTTSEREALLRTVFSKFKRFQN